MGDELWGLKNEGQWGEEDESQKNRRRSDICMLSHHPLHHEVPGTSRYLPGFGLVHFHHLRPCPIRAIYYNQHWLSLSS